jgi:methylated-DNA-[protein]-cysteine S-methyltransferase
MYEALLPSPIGPLHVAADDHGHLTHLYTDRHRRHGPARPDHDGVFAAVSRQLDEYWAGTRTTFDDLELNPHGTPFELSVWQALRAIPYGETRSYGELATALGSVARAVGRANGANPISIIVPCHRIIGATGALTGYAGGLDAKRALLDHERGVGAFALTA